MPPHHPAHGCRDGRFDANDFNQILPPIILNLILQYLTDPSSLTDGEGDDSWYAYGLVVLMYLLMNLKTIVENNYVK